MRFMSKQFSHYYKQFEKEDRNTRIALAASGIGLLLFFAIALTIPLKGLFEYFFQKSPSDASVLSIANEAENGTIDNPAIILMPGNDPLASGTGNNYVLFTQAGSAVTPTPIPGATRLKWAPPVLVNPTTINLTTGATSNTLDTSRDYIINLPATKKTGYTWLTGGRNIIIRGGHVTTPSGYTSTNERRAFYIKDNVGTVHIEGVLIDSSGGGEHDAFAINSANSIVQLQNIRVTDLKGSYNSEHSDIIQPWGGVKELRIDRMTGSTNYQGFYFVQTQTYGIMEKIIAQNVNFSHQTNPVQNVPRMLYMVYDACDYHPGSVSFTNVYFKPNAQRPFSETTYPSTTTPSACKATLSSGTPRQLTWPSLTWMTGSVIEGDPPGGDFVPTGVAGTSYVSPGYESDPTPTPTPGAPACPILPANTGMITQTVSIPEDGTYTIWSRVKGTDNASNSYYLQIDDTCGITVGDLDTANSFPVNSWTWVDYKDGSTENKIQMSLTAGSHSVKMIGHEAGLQLDRVIFTKEGCTPVDTGDNCILPPTPTTAPPTNTPAVPPSTATIITDSASGSHTVGNPFTVAVKINGGGQNFNAAQATVTVSPNMTASNLTAGDCNFTYIPEATPSTENPSFAGAILNGSSQACTVYTIQLTPVSAGAGTVTFTDASVKAYTTSGEILASVQNGSYTFAVPTNTPTPTPIPPTATPTPTLTPTPIPPTATPTPTLTPTPVISPPEISTEIPVKTYKVSQLISGQKAPSVTQVFVNGSAEDVTYPTETTWQKTLSLAIGQNIISVYGVTAGGQQTTESNITITGHKLADINGDGAVNLTDLSLFGADWGKQGQNISQILSDMNDNSVVDLADFSILAKAYEG